ncbi:MAG: [Citrate [pro-3S]-lyase] ligase [Candidatus Dichloromethanomonas elyunquensis]|nr:MAG: [Citrate [pro-3S]-lyase] ligase [Candidatus Dichloromethanomonas elyunquensis]
MKIFGINLAGPVREEVERFLASNGLKLEKDVEYTAVAVCREEIVGTCSFAGNVVKCFAVRPDWQGAGIAAQLLTHISDILFSKGITETFIFTKPENGQLFSGLGYRSVAATPQVILLEGGTANIGRYINEMVREAGINGTEKAAIVMNCNPFTLGHRYLIETAARENEQVIVFVVEENRSCFSFTQRLNLVRQGTADLTNVIVIPGGRYIISANTFPTYFLKDRQISVYQELDALIFARYLAPAFNIRIRYVGTEPHCQVTNNYVEALQKILPSYGVKVCLVERVKSKGECISASRVRQLYEKCHWEELRDLLPPCTYDFLRNYPNPGSQANQAD